MWKKVKVFVGWFCLAIVVGEVILITVGAFTIHATIPASDIRALSGGAPLFSLKTTSGTGLFINNGGDVLTNRHNVNGCRRITVSGDGFRAIKARIVASSQRFDRDLAVIHIDVAPENKAHFFIAKQKPTANSGKPNDALTLVGFPFYDRSDIPILEKINEAILVRTRGSDDFLVQIDGRNDRGESGSPLFDADGNVFGIVFAASTSLKDLETNTEPSDRAFAVFAPNVIEWLLQSGIVFDASPSHPTSRANLPLAAVVRVFCFS